MRNTPSSLLLHKGEVKEPCSGSISTFTEIEFFSTGAGIAVLRPESWHLRAHFLFIYVHFHRLGVLLSRWGALLSVGDARGVKGTWGPAVSA